MVTIILANQGSQFTTRGGLLANNRKKKKGVKFLHNICPFAIAISHLGFCFKGLHTPKPTNYIYIYRYKYINMAELEFRIQIQSNL